MSRYIDADKLYPDRLTRDGGLAISQNQIAAAETVDVIPAVYGRWIQDGENIYHCFNCGRTVVKDWTEDMDIDYPFCHCGSDNRSHRPVVGVAGNGKSALLSTIESALKELRSESNKSTGK